jgi:hypothetical protein
MSYLYKNYLSVTYQKARQLSFKVKWKVSSCGDKDCWCAIIEPEDPIVCNFNDTTGDYIVVSSGAIDKETAQHIVLIHNSYL